MAAELERRALNEGRRPAPLGLAVGEVAVHQGAECLRPAVEDFQAHVVLRTRENASHEIVHAERAVDISDELTTTLPQRGWRNGAVNGKIKKEAGLDILLTVDRAEGGEKGGKI